jgi:hypothetical protein
VKVATRRFLPPFNPDAARIRRMEGFRVLGFLKRVPYKHASTFRLEV